MIKYTIQEIIFPIFFSPGDTHAKGVLFLLHLGLEGVMMIHDGHPPTHTMT